MLSRHALLCCAAAIVAGASSAQAANFTNGSFEGGTLTGWTQGGGYWYGGAYPTPQQYLPGGSNFVAGAAEITVTNAGFDANTGNNLRTAYAGQHSARVNNPSSNYSVSVLSQTVTNYTDNLIAFAYAAVLESSHDTTDSDAFIITLEDLTTGSTLFSYNLNSATAPGLFQRSGSWYYTDWVETSIDVSNLLGHDFRLSLLANDCPSGGHAGYAYLDGFGGVVGGDGSTPGAVPEPASWAMMIGGFGLVGGALRRRAKTAITFA